jgi:hypothetical protein
LKKKKSEQVGSAAANHPPHAATAATTKSAARPVIQSISIKQAMAGKTVSAAETGAPLPAETSVAPLAVSSKTSGNQPVAQEALTVAWNAFADSLKTEDIRLFSILTAQIPELDGETKIVFRIGSPLQKEPLQKIQSRLLQYLFAALDNHHIEIEIVISEKSETAKAYTAEEKFVQMSLKNPVLKTFKQQFTLDFD